MAHNGPGEEAGICFILSSCLSLPTVEAFRKVLQAGNDTFVALEPCVKKEEWDHLVETAENTALKLTVLLIKAEDRSETAAAALPFIATAVRSRNPDEEYVPDVPPPENMSAAGIVAGKVLAASGKIKGEEKSKIFLSGEDVLGFFAAAKSKLPPHGTMAAGVLRSSQAGTTDGEIIEAAGKLIAFIKGWASSLPDSGIGKIAGSIYETYSEQIWLTSSMKHELRSILTALYEKKGLAPGEVFSSPRIANIIHSSGNAKVKGKKILDRLKELLCGVR